MEDLRPTVALAEQATRIAGDYLLAHQDQTRIIMQKAPDDPLLDADLEAQRLILQTLQSGFPELGFLSEEAEDQRHGARDYWIIDPVDGSHNYLHKSTQFAIAIALVLDQQVQAGIISLPARKWMFSAIRGGGALCNGQPIQVSSTATLKQAMIHFGEFGRDNHGQIRTEQLQAFATLANQAQRIRHSGSSSCDLALLAFGAIDGFVMHMGNPWDIAAGELLLSEAGGHTSVHPIGGGSIRINSNTVLHSELVHLLTGFDDPSFRPV
ncbi:MAG TPA: inositol monophosphatase family protein [Ktedonobacteraceae bacterium]|nr:inositol monophosphatase family protein [Ktedonobacteraceae bacterium]